MKLFYQRGPVTLWHGDCLEWLATLGPVDAIITDPPYGVNLGVTNNQCDDGTHLKKKAYASYDDSYENFTTTIVPRLNLAISAAKCAAVFSGPNIHEQQKPSAIGGIFCPCATGRTPWGSKNFLPLLLYGNPRTKPGLHRPTVLVSTAVSEKNGHPCPKPMEWMLWAIELATLEGDMVADPFTGSGTTAEACIRTGRRFVGCELDEAYCKIAAERCDRELDQGKLFEPAPPKPIQKSLISE